MWTRLMIWLGTWLLARYAPVTPQYADTREAVRAVCDELGLNIYQMTDETDLARTGKLYDVLWRASHVLGKNHELRTLGDVIAWLEEAPKQ